MKFRLIAMLLFVLCLSCDKDDDIVKDSNGVVIRRPHLWATDISDNYAMPQVSISTPIIYDNSNILVGSGENKQNSIMSLDANNGHVNWEWSDLQGLLNNPSYKDPIHIPRKAYHLNNNKFFFNYSTSSYCINLETGQTLWKNKLERSRDSNNAGIDDFYFSEGSQYSPIDEQKIYWGNINSADDEQLLLRPDYTEVPNPPYEAQGHVNSMRPFTYENNTYLAFGIENPYPDLTPGNSGFTELNLYNITQSKYEYKKVVVNSARETRVIGDLFYQDGRLYFQSSNYIHGYDAMTGKELWRAFIGSSPLTSRMILANNKLFSACEDRILYCVDALTGIVLWREQNTGTCSELTYLNGVVYYLGGGDGLLHAVDAETGKHLWKISSPDLKKSQDAWFFGVCIAVPGEKEGEGVVVATTGLNAYAYRAIK
jgi:outer membrane protein assembly factor BamB